MFLTLFYLSSEAQFCYKPRNSDEECPEVVNPDNIFADIKDLTSIIQKSSEETFVHVRINVNDSAEFEVDSNLNGNVTFIGIEEKLLSISLKKCSSLNVTIEKLKCSLISETEAFLINNIIIKHSTISSTSALIATSIDIENSKIDIQTINFTNICEIENIIIEKDVKLSGISSLNYMNFTSKYNHNITCGNELLIEYESGKKITCRTKEMEMSESSSLPESYILHLLGNCSITTHSIKHYFGRTYYSIFCFGNVLYNCNTEDFLPCIEIFLENATIRSIGLYDPQRLITRSGSNVLYTDHTHVKIESIIMYIATNLLISGEGTLFVTIISGFGDCLLTSYRNTTIKKFDIDYGINHFNTYRISGRALQIALDSNYTFNIRNVKVEGELIAAPYPIAFNNLEIGEKGSIKYKSEVMEITCQLLPIIVTGEIKYSKKLSIVISVPDYQTNSGLIDYCLLKNNMTLVLIVCKGIKKEDVLFKDDVGILAILARSLSPKYSNDNLSMKFNEQFRNLFSYICIVPTESDMKYCRKASYSITKNDEIDFSKFKFGVFKTYIEIPIDMEYSINIDSLKETSCSITSKSKLIHLTSNNNYVSIDSLTLDGNFCFTSSKESLELNGQDLKWISGSIVKSNTQIAIGSYKKIIMSSSIASQISFSNISSVQKIFYVLSEKLTDIIYHDDGWTFIYGENQTKTRVQGGCKSAYIMYNETAHQSINTARTIRLSLENENIKQPQVINLVEDFIKLELAENTKNIRKLLAILLSPKAIITSTNQLVPIAFLPTFNTFYLSFPDPYPKTLENLIIIECKYFINSMSMLSINTTHILPVESDDDDFDDFDDEVLSHESMINGNNNCFIENLIVHENTSSEVINTNISMIKAQYNTTITIDTSAIGTIQLYIKNETTIPQVNLGNNIKNTKPINIEINVSNVSSYLYFDNPIINVQDNNPVKFNTLSTIKCQGKEYKVVLTRKNNHIYFRVESPMKSKGKLIYIIVPIGSVLLVTLISILIYCYFRRKNKVDESSLTETLMN